MPHVVFLRPDLSYSGATQRAISTGAALVEAGARVTFLTRGGSRSSAARAHGIELSSLELLPDRLGRPFLKRRLFERLFELKPTSLHVVAAELAELGPPIARVARRLGLPYVLEATRPVTREVAFDEALLGAVIVPAESLAEPLVNHGRLPRELFVFIPGAPPDESPSQTPRVPLAHTSPPVIGCTGSFDDGFDGDWFLEAARIAKETKKPWRFVMLGEGPHERELRRRARSAGLASSMTIGVPTTDKALATLRSLDIHVSCRTDTGPGWLALQTMRLGIPNLFAAAGEAFSLIKDQHDGILIQPGDARRLADELASLIANPDRARSLGQAGRRTSFERSPRTAFEAAVRGLHGVELTSESPAP